MQPGARRSSFSTQSRVNLTITSRSACCSSHSAGAYAASDTALLPCSYRLVPMGSFSRIERTTGDKASYELYGSGDLHFVRLLHNRRFDLGMVAFLDCLKHLMEYIASQDPSVDFPHE